jgi:hypothetical protein
MYPFLFCVFFKLGCCFLARYGLFYFSDNFLYIIVERGDFMAAGRPRKHNIDEIIEKLNDYINTTEIPVIAEFAYQNNIRRDYLYELAKTNDELTNAIKRIIEKKEAQLEIKSLKGEINSTQAIFSLKQLGWKDKQEIETKNTHINGNDDIPRMTFEEKKALYQKYIDATIKQD